MVEKSDISELIRIKDLTEKQALAVANIIAGGNNGDNNGGNDAGKPNYMYWVTVLMTIVVGATIVGIVWLTSQSMDLNKRVSDIEAGQKGVNSKLEDILSRLPKRP